MMPVDNIEVTGDRYFPVTQAINTNNSAPDKRAGSLIPNSESPTVSSNTLL